MKKHRKAELASLDEWTHINCLRPSATDGIHDEILKSIVRESQVQGKQEDSASQLSRRQRLLADLDNVLNESLDPDDLSARPAGTLTYLFEKSSL